MILHIKISFSNLLIYYFVIEVIHEAEYCYCRAFLKNRTLCSRSSNVFWGFFLLLLFSGWLRFHNKCYIIRGRHTHHEERANWTYARDWCKNQEGHLAVIDDINENGKCPNEELSYSIPLSYPGFIHCV